MTIKRRLILGFSIVIILLLGVALFGALKINSMHKTTENLYNHPYTVNMAVSEIRYILADCDRTAGKVANGFNINSEDAGKTIAEHGKQIKERLAIIESQFLGDKNLYQDFIKIGDQLNTSYIEVLEKAKEGNLPASKEEYITNTNKSYDKAQAQLNKFSIFAKGKGVEFFDDSSEKRFNTLLFFGVIASIIILVSILLAIINIKAITKPLDYAQASAKEIATGNLEIQFDVSKKDEIGQLLSSIQVIVNNIKAASDFTENIGKGEINADFSPVGEHDTLGNSLIEMRHKLQQVADEDEKRNWSTRGLAIFGEILRGNSNDINVFGQEIISKLIEYLEINQGGIFIINDTNPKDPKMDLIAAYAYDRQKFLTKEIRKREGLIGQSWEENDKIYLTNVPDDYIHVKSGLGDANPSSVLIIPLKENDDIYGMLELASFHPFEDHEINFLELLAQSIGATFKNLKTKIQTTKLLEESQGMQQMMQEQEEELRQNNEEMQATAEQVHKEAEMHKAEMEGAMKELNSRINILDEMCLVSETNKKGEIVNINQKFMDVALYTKAELVGEPHNIVRHPDMPKEAWKACWATIGKGETFRSIVKNKAKDGSAYWVDAVISPKKGINGKPDGYIGVRYDITEQIQQFETYTLKVGDQEFTIPTK